jgi:hypothetical protein
MNFTHSIYTLPGRLLLKAIKVKFNTRHGGIEIVVFKILGSIHGVFFTCLSIKYRGVELVDVLPDLAGLQFESDNFEEPCYIKGARAILNGETPTIDCDYSVTDVQLQIVQKPVVGTYEYDSYFKFSQDCIGLKIWEKGKPQRATYVTLPVAFRINDVPITHADSVIFDIAVELFDNPLFAHSPYWYDDEILYHKGSFEFNISIEYDLKKNVKQLLRLESIVRFHRSQLQQLQINRAAKP